MEQKELVKVLVKKPGEDAVIREIGTSLKDYQNEVQGYIQSIPFPGMDDVDIVLNEDGKLIGMKPNVIVPEYGDLLVGPIFIIGVDERTCLWKSLPDDKIDTIKKYLSEHDMQKLGRK